MPKNKIELRIIRNAYNEITISLDGNTIVIDVKDFINYKAFSIDLQPKQAKVLSDSIKWGLSLNEENS